MQQNPHNLLRKITRFVLGCVMYFDASPTVSIYSGEYKFHRYIKKPKSPFFITED